MRAVIQASIERQINRSPCSSWKVILQKSQDNNKKEMLSYFLLLRAAEIAKSSEKIKKNIYAVTVISSRKFR